MLEVIQSGQWLTKTRARAYCWIILIAFGAALLAILATSHGRFDFLKRPLGMDFSGVYAAGLSAREGRPAAPYDNPAQLAEEQKLFGSHAPFLSWSYPPFFLAVATPLAALPYLAALAIYESSTLALLLTAVKRIIPARGWLLPCLAFPGLFINLVNGQNGFLTAGLLTWALVLLEDRPIVAGVLFGLASYKPQLGILVPFALVAGRRWRAITSACATIVAMVIATGLYFGPLVWLRFVQSMTFARRMTEEGSAGFFKIQSVFSTVRQLGGGLEAAYFAQAASTLICVVVVTTLWARKSDWRIKSAALMSAAVLATPYAFDYDLTLLGPAILMLASVVAERGPMPWEISGLALVWFIPAAARPLSQETHFSWGAAGAAIMLGAVVRAARRAKPEKVLAAAPM